MWNRFIRNRLKVGREVQGRARPGTIQKELVKSRLVKIGVRVQMRGLGSVSVRCVLRKFPRQGTDKHLGNNIFLHQ